MSWLALACSLSLTLLAWSIASRSLHAQLRDHFVQRSEQVSTAILRRMQEHEAVLRGCVALFLASDDVTRSEFHDYQRHLDLEAHYPGIQGIGFARLLRADQLDATRAAVRAEGFGSFEVTPAGARDWYTPIVFLEPMTGRNLRAFGYDMFSEPNRRATMELAWRSERPAISPIVRLVQDTASDHQPGFLIYLPIFRAVEGTTWEPTRTPIGFIYSPLRTRDLMRGILGQGPSDIDFALYDQAAEHPFYDTRSAEAAARPELMRERPLELSGRTWRAVFWSRPNFGSWISRSEPQAVLVAGLLINVLLFWILGVNATLQSRASTLAEQMTEELKLAHAREQNQMLASLREKETLLKEIHHRVKNNLQVVSSLLSLQRNHVQDEAALEPLRQSQRRVLAMAALHEFLYRSRDLSRVDMSAYLSHLVTVLSESYPSGERVNVISELDDVPLDVDRAIPCGLITNELVSNAFKYGFQEGQRGTLTVGLRRDGDDVVLHVADDGAGLPAGHDLDNPSTLGLQLVALLTQQLGGSIAVCSPGACFEIHFPFAKRSGPT